MMINLPPNMRTGASLRAASQAGFSLVEILVAVLVTAIGVLGLASLQIVSLGGTMASQERTQASILALDLSDRMRNNAGAMRDGSYDLVLGVIPPAATCRGAGADCTPAQLAAADLSEWRALVGGLLAGGAAGVATDTPVGSTITNITITITWVDTKALPGDAQADQLVIDFSI